MGVRRRTYDIAKYIRTTAADRAAMDAARRVVEWWNGELAAGLDIWWSPTIRAALVDRAAFQRSVLSSEPVIRLNSASLGSARS